MTSPLASPVSIGSYADSLNVHERRSGTFTPSGPIDASARSDVRKIGEVGEVPMVDISYERLAGFLRIAL
jgi:hypothetical protein